MDAVRNSLEIISGASMISDVPDSSDALEVSETTGLSPATQGLSLDEADNSNMGIENSWSEAQGSAACWINESSFATFDDGNSDVMYGPSPQPSVQLNNISVDNSDNLDSALYENATRGVCGLQNLGNTCFMAAGLQCLTATPPVMEYFIKCQHQGEKSTQPESLMAHFSTLVSKMWSGKYNVLKPSEFKQILGVYHSQFKDYRQHDCQEFLALLLDSLHEQMNLAKLNKDCHPPTTAETVISNQNGKRELDSIDFTANNECDNNLDNFDDQIMTDCPNSPNLTMVGSPRDSIVDDYDNSLWPNPDSPLNNDDEETLDSEEILGSKSKSSSNFIHNDVCELLKESSCLNKFNDIVKDAKTSNANFLVTPQEINNEIHYDSQKFPRGNIRTLTLENSNLTENHDFDNKSVSVKRIKEVNIQKNNAHNDYNCVSNGIDSEYDYDLEKCNVKRMRLEDREKNHIRDGLSSGVLCTKSTQNCESNSAVSENEADKHWAKHLKLNKSIIVNTFQGQFKSSVVCSNCSNISVTYEPFMYLSVPLPHAMERQLTVTYIPADGNPPIRCVVSLNKQSKVGKLKEEVLKILRIEVPISKIVFAEVLDKHISKIIEDNTLLRCINTLNRSLYAFEMVDPPEPYKQSNEGLKSNGVSEKSYKSESASENVGSCIICLEEMDRDLKKHTEPNCNYLVCDPCIENYFKNQSEPTRCPMCKNPATESSFVKVDQADHPVSTVRILNVPLILRYDTDEATNNRKSSRLFGYPHLFKLPSIINAKDLNEVVKRVVPKERNYTLHFVDPQGTRCSRCLFDKHCSGCKIPETGSVTLQNCDTLAVRYTEVIPSVQPIIDHVSYKNHRPNQVLSLYDCLQAFSQSETLDENNPWFCPKCERNQCATKTLTVHRYPKYLIVYLKRFVYYENVSMKLDDKVTFPLLGLNCGNNLYDLYACVCHYGGVSAGHYTAYAKNPKSDSWHHYNDDIISKQKPQEEDFSNAYILFYSRQEINIKQCNNR